MIKIIKIIIIIIIMIIIIIIIMINMKRVRKILKSKLNGGNVISAINSRAVAVVRYGAGIIKWTKLELEELDRKTRKLMTIYGAHHPTVDVDRLYMKI